MNEPARARRTSCGEAPEMARPMSWQAAGTAAMVVSVAGHCYALYAPGSPEPPTFDIPGLDKAVHMALFAVPVALARLLSRRWWPVGLFACHAPVSEIVQWAVVPLRSGDPWDLAADLAGVAAGVAAAAWCRRLVGCPAQPQTAASTKRG